MKDKSFIARFKLSTKCRQLEKQKWELPKKFPFLHRLYRERGLPSPLALSPCESDLLCMGLSTVWNGMKDKSFIARF